MFEVNAVELQECLTEDLIFAPVPQPRTRILAPRQPWLGKPIVDRYFHPPGI